MTIRARAKGANAKSVKVIDWSVRLLMACWIVLTILLISLASLSQAGCGYVAAGATGAAIGDRIAKAQDEKDD